MMSGESAGDEWEEDDVLKNREIRRHIIITVIITIIICLMAYLFNIPSAAAVIITMLLLSGLWLADMMVRYRHMAGMAHDIDLILHGNESNMLSEYEEGDISILRNEISKMTIMLRQQAEQLGGEKAKLADSLADISHQIRTPLTSLNLMLEALKNEQDEEKRLRLVFDMRKQLERIDGLIVSLLQLAKMDAGAISLKKGQINLNELVCVSLQPLEIMLELKKIAVTIDVSGSFVGDKEWSREALTNILKNCMEHTKEDGSIRITGCNNAVHTELVIEDTGCGIADDDLPHIFERFYKGSNSKNDSYGIGLALARAIIAGQNGTIKAENVKGTDGNTCGARFIIRFYKGIV